MNADKQLDGKNSMGKVLLPWKTLKREDVFVAKPWIQLSVEQVRLPDGRVVDDYYQMYLPDCVIIFAQTKDEKVVVERQYKHGVRKVTLTLPTGGIAEGEEPVSAAQRELREETGYVSTDWRYLGRFVLMANQGGATIHLYRAHDAQQVAQPESSSDLEEMDIVLLELDELFKAIREDDICVLSTVTTILLATHPVCCEIEEAVKLPR